MLASAKGFAEILLHIDTDTKELPIINLKEVGSPLRIVQAKRHLEIGPAYDMLCKEVNTEWICAFCDDDYFEDGLKNAITFVNNEPKAEIVHFKAAMTGFMPFKDKRALVYKFIKNVIAPFLAKKHLYLDIKYLFGYTQNITVKLLEKDNVLPAGSFFKKKVWEKVGGFKGRITHDWIFWLRAARMNFRFKYIDEVVYTFERRENSAWFKKLKEEAGNDWKKCREIVHKEAIVTYSRSGRAATKEMEYASRTV
jgi:hypothetical protein